MDIDIFNYCFPHWSFRIRHTLVLQIPFPKAKGKQTSSQENETVYESNLSPKGKKSVL